MPERQLKESSIPLRERVVRFMYLSQFCTEEELNADLEVLLSTRYMEPA